MKYKFALALGIAAVSALGVVVGVYFIAPFVSADLLNHAETILATSLERLRALPWASGTGGSLMASLSGYPSGDWNPAFLVATGSIIALIGVVAFLMVRRLRTRARARAGRTRSFRDKQGRKNLTPRTPRDVEAMAASGKAPVEIAARTGLPVDAVAMLLSLRQPA